MAVKAVVTEIGASTIPQYILTLGFGNFSAGGGAPYTLSLDAGLFTESGQDVIIAASRKLTMDYGSFTLTGQDIAGADTLNLWLFTPFGLRIRRPVPWRL